MPKRTKIRISRAKLAARRAALNLTQAVVAHRAALLLPNYARLEQTDSNPTVDTAVRVARALGCFVEDLLA